MAEETKKSTTDQPVEDPKTNENTATATEESEETPKEVTRMEAENQSGVLLNKIENEIRRGYRDMDIPDFGMVRIYLPDVKVDQKLSDVKVELVAKFITDKGVITREEIMNGLRERGLWDDQHEQDEERYTADIVDLTREMMYERHSDEIDYERLRDLSARKKELEKKRNDLTATRDYFLTASLESKVDIMLFKHQMALCVRKLDEEGNESPLWDGIEELEEDKRKYLVNRVSTAAGYFWNGWSEDLLQDALGM